MLQNQDSLQTINSLVISSDLLSEPVKVESFNSICPGVFERSISGDYAKHQKTKERISFDLTIMIHEKWSSGEESPVREKSVQFTLENILQEETEPKLSYLIWPLANGNRLLSVYVN